MLISESGVDAGGPVSSRLGSGSGLADNGTRPKLPDPESDGVARLMDEISSEEAKCAPIPVAFSPEETSH